LAVWGRTIGQFGSLGRRRCLRDRWRAHRPRCGGAGVRAGSHPG
jgi:hypothetical protein